MSREFEIWNVSVTESTQVLLSSGKLCLKKIEKVGEHCELILANKLKNNTEISADSVILGFSATADGETATLIVGSQFSKTPVEALDAAFKVVATRMNRYKNRATTVGFWGEVESSVMQAFLLLSEEVRNVDAFIEMVGRDEFRNIFGSV